jgi:hypothetical protein
VDGAIVKNRRAISKEKAWQYLCVLLALRPVTDGVHEILLTCISILSIKLRVETCVEDHVRE